MGATGLFREDGVLVEERGLVGNDTRYDFYGSMK